MKIGYQQEANTLPTNFAIALCESVGILKPQEDHHGNKLCGVDYMDQNIRLKQFQQMSIACSFHDAMIAFYGQQFDETQIKALEIVFRSTKPWLLGATVGVLMDRINNNRITNRDFAIAVTAIMEQININGTPDGGGSLDGTKKVTAKLEGLMFKEADLKTNGKKKPQ